MDKYKRKICVTVVIRRLGVDRELKDPPRLGRGSATAAPWKANRAAKQAKTLSRCRPLEPTDRPPGILCFVIEIPSKGVRLLLGLARLPMLILLEQVGFFLLRHRRTAGRLPALIDKTRKHRQQFVWARRLGRLQVPLQPLVGRGIAPPAGHLGSQVDLLPLRVVAGFEQCGRPVKNASTKLPTLR